MAEEIRPGSVVRLASGGPAMTVKKFLEGGDAVCQWFDDKTLMDGTFPRASLATVTSGAGAAAPFYTPG
jgi:uncharacterized protein YodC (DUF2158 family)